MRGQGAAGGSSRQHHGGRGGASAGQQEYAVGSKVQCTATFDSQLHAAEVLDIRTAASGQKQYYVHFIGLDKRLDEWVAADKLLPASSTHGLARLESVPSLALPAELLTQTDGQKITRRLKRRLEDSHAVPAHEDTNDHGPKTGPEKEHAERNKVKNVQVGLGLT